MFLIGFKKKVIFSISFENFTSIESRTQ